MSPHTCNPCPRSIHNPQGVGGMVLAREPFADMVLEPYRLSRSRAVGPPLIYGSRNGSGALIRGSGNGSGASTPSEVVSGAIRRFPSLFAFGASLGIRLPPKPQDSISLRFEKPGGARTPETGHRVGECKGDTSENRGRCVLGCCFVWCLDVLDGLVPVSRRGQGVQVYR
jgi:hypothetical protein